MGTNVYKSLIFTTKKRGETPRGVAPFAKLICLGKVDCLLNGNTLSQVSRLIDIAPPMNGTVVSKQLQRNRNDQG